MKSAARAIDILEVLAEVPHGLSHGDLARRLNIPRSSLSGILETLVSRNFVEWDEISRRYVTGFAVLRLGRSYLSRLDLVQCARPMLERLSEEIGEACALTVRYEHSVVVVAKMDDPNQLRPSLSLQLGHAGPIYASASGKAMLAAEGPAAVTAYLASVETMPLDPNRKLDTKAFRRDLEAALCTGFGWSRGEMFDDIVAVGVAIHGIDGKVVAGLSVSLPNERCSPEHLEAIQAALKSCAGKLSVRMGAAA